ncbi:MAG: MXAN_5187 C-terminal domain-containing protein [Acidobacteriota bacterium]
MDPKRPVRSGGLPNPVIPKAGQAAAVQPQQARRAGPAIGEALDQLARDIRQLQIDFERFFNGGLPLPPEELRTRVQTQLRNLRNLNMPSAVESFRLNDLEARYNSYNELFNRRLRDVEEGRRGPHKVFAFVERSRFDPRGGIVFGSDIDPEAAEALYHGLSAGAGDGPRFDLDSFQTYLRRQTEAIRQKTGCSEVQFRVTEEEGKLKLKARPVPSRQGS